MTDIRRTILWTVFSISLVLLWDAWNRHNGQPSMFFPTASTPTAANGKPASAAANAASGVPAAIAGAAAPGAAAATPTAAANAATAPGEIVTIGTDVIKAQFDSRGAQLVKLELLKHADHNTNGGPVVLFDRSAERLYLAQTGFVTTQPGVSLPTHQTMMKAVAGVRDMANGQNTLALSFEGEEGGVKIKKTYTFERGSYVINVQNELTNTGAAPVSPQLYLRLVRDGNAPIGESSMILTFTGPAQYTDLKKFHKIDFKDIEKGKAEIDKSANNGWIAMIQHYFTSAWLLPAGVQREFRVEKVDTNQYAIAMVTPFGDLAPGATKSDTVKLYAGPQEEKKLAELAPGLDLVKDYGWFRVLASPLFWLLDKLHSVLGNWGWAIVALVVLLKIAFYSLNASAYRSMAKMKAVGPRVQELRERHKDNPQKMQQEMMRIYKEEKVNPVGGCLPIFIQMPFFIALYWVLLSSAEMRNAPWIGWITDLSAKDPYYILPLLMMGSSVLQVALGAKAPDPMQQRMMWIMPIAFGVMFFFFPAGLVLYWLTNNILSIAQQWYINKKMGVANLK